MTPCSETKWYCVIARSVGPHVRLWADILRTVLANSGICFLSSGSPQVHFARSMFSGSEYLNITDVDLFSKNNVVHDTKTCEA